MSAPSWFGPALANDQRDVVAVVDSIGADHPAMLTDDGTLVDLLVTHLAAVGVWTLGTDETTGGGGADHATTMAALTRIGRFWPALGWASVQVHAAIDVLSTGGFESLIAALHGGTARVAVVHGDSEHVTITRDGTGLRGTVLRVDTGGEQPHLVILHADHALLIDRSVITTEPLVRTGLGGAFTRSLEIDATLGDTATAIDDVDTAMALQLLLVGAAAIASGIASAAADDALAYAATRHQFGGPLTDLPTVRASLMDQVESTVVATGAAMSRPANLTNAAAVLDYACEAAVDVASAALQVHGGYGYLAEYPAEGHLRDAISLRAATDGAAAATRSARLLVGLGGAAS